VTGSSWVTHGDRARWQQQAARELAAILDEGADLPLIAWTVAAAGGSLAGQVTGAGARAAFAAWRQALALDDVAETAVSGGTWLRARGWRGEVRVTVTATVPAAGAAAAVTS
jgi:hypothetical protein